MHTVAFHWPQTDQSHEGFMCVCGDIFVEGKEGNHNPSIIQMSEHLKDNNFADARVDV